jgi:signal transduction histidine kinase
MSLQVPQQNQASCSSATQRRSKGLATIAPLLKDADVTLTVSLGRHPLVIRGDAERLIQLFSNLVVNAIKCTPRGGRIEVPVRRPS